MYLIPFIVYCCVLLLIGYISYHKQTSSTDFIVGNRSLNFWVTALSAHASDMSSWLFMAFPAAVFIGGLSQSWIAFGLLLGMFMNWQFVAKKLRLSTETYDTCTLSTFFEKRFKDNTQILRLVTAAVAIFFLTCYVSVGLIAMGRIFESLFGIDFAIGLSVSTLVILIYTLVGGYVTIAWTDLFQALFLLGMIILVPAIAFLHLENGVTTIVTAAEARGMSLAFIPDYSFTTLVGILFLALEWGLGYFGQPHIVTKFMGINRADNMNKSKYVGMSWQILTLAAATCVGLVGIGFFGDSLQKPEEVFVEMVKVLFHPLAGGFILCSILAASVSTMDSQILVSASVISEDVYKKIFRNHATQKELLMVSRIGVVFISLLSLYFALDRSTTIQEAVLYAWSGLGSSFGPLVLMALYSKHTNNYGAIAGVLVGGAVSGLWGSVNPYVTSFTIPAMIPGFGLSLLSIYLVSAVTRRAQRYSSTS